MPRPKGSADQLEQRRRRALALVSTGLSFREAGRRMHCAASSVMRWFHAWQRGGSDALAVVSPPGRPSKLLPAQRRRLVKLLFQGPAAHGYRTNRWTTVRIAEVIDRQYGVHYHHDHIGRLMRSLGWACQEAAPGWAPVDPNCHRCARGR
jgi:transposase